MVDSDAIDAGRVLNASKFFLYNTVAVTETNRINEGVLPHKDTTMVSYSPCNNRTRSIIEVLTRKEIVSNGSKRMKPLTTLHDEGSNIVVELDEEAYEKGVDDLKYNMDGRFTI